MSSTEQVNVDGYIQTLRQDEELPDEEVEEIIRFVNDLSAEGISPSQQRKYLYNLKTIVAKFAPDGFTLREATEQELRTTMAAVHRSGYSDSSKRKFAIALKKFYKHHNDGEEPDKVAFITTTKKKATNVTREDLFTDHDLEQLFAAFTNLRDTAFFRTLYESAARPGELHDSTIADVEFNDKGDFIHLEGSKGTPDRTNQLIDAGNALREWIKRHPAGGPNPHQPRDPSAPLWITVQDQSCQRCNTKPSTHRQLGCDRYQPGDIQEVKYSALYRSFKRACTRAGIGDHRPYDFRHTRITEVSRFMSHEQLCKFAGWVPGSDRAKVYVHLTNDDVNQAIRNEHGLQVNDQENQKQVCQVCGQKNDQNRHECHNCKRPLSLENAERQDQLKDAIELYQQLEDDGGIENLKKIEKLLENADRIEELIERSGAASLSTQ